MILNRDIFILFIIAFASSLIALSIRDEPMAKSNKLSQLLIQDSSIHFDAIQEIVVIKDGEQFQYKLIEGKWWQVFPYQTRMNSVSMSAIIRSVQSVQILGELPETINHSTLGLEKQTNAISLTDGNEVLNIKLGRKTLGGRAYAQVGESLPAIVDQTLHRQITDADHRLWRDVRMFPDFSIDGIRIERVVNGEKLLLDRASGRWEMLEPVTARVDQDVLLEWVGKLASIQIESFVVDNPTDLAMFGLHIPVASFLVHDRKDTAYHLLVGGRVSSGSQDRYVMLEGRPAVYKVSWKLLSHLFPHAEIFVDATGSAISRFDIKRITIRSGDSEFKVLRKNEQWITEKGVPFDSETVEALLVWLLDTRPPEVVIGEYPRVHELATITFEGYDLTPLDTVRVARDPDGSFILENGDNVLRLHPVDSGEPLEPFLTRLLQK